MVCSNCAVSDRSAVVTVQSSDQVFQRALPSVSIGSARWKTWSDDWTVTTADLSLTAQFEHTIVIRPDGPEILTASLDGTV